MAPPVRVPRPLVVNVVHAIDVPWIGPGDAGPYPLVGPVVDAIERYLL